MYTFTTHLISSRAHSSCVMALLYLNNCHCFFFFFSLEQRRIWNTLKNSFCCQLKYFFFASVCYTCIKKLQTLLCEWGCLKERWAFHSINAMLLWNSFLQWALFCNWVLHGDVQKKVKRLFFSLNVFTHFLTIHLCHSILLLYSLIQCNL